MIIWFVDYDGSVADAFVFDQFPIPAEDNARLDAFVKARQDIRRWGVVPLSTVGSASPHEDIESYLEAITKEAPMGRSSITNTTESDMDKIKMGESVTNEQWAAFRPDHTYPEGHNNKPVVSISYDDAMEYAGWLSRQTGRKFRLPTEDERKAAEDTFEADYSKHPLPECPDVGTFGGNAVGVTGLKGTTWDWCLHPDDHNPEKLGWVTEETEAPPPVEGAEALRKLLLAVETLRAAGIKVEL